jgi:hypothetical protein
LLYWYKSANTDADDASVSTEGSLVSIKGISALHTGGGAAGGHALGGGGAASAGASAQWILSPAPDGANAGRWTQKKKMS